MPSAAQLRTVIEHQLAQRIPAALTPAVWFATACASTGIPALDEQFAGLPVGAMTEATGAPGTGRTSLAMVALSVATGAGQVVAWVDVACTFNPESAAANGILLDRLLWVCCQNQGGQASHGFVSGTPSLAFETPLSSRVQHGGGSPHPRSEERGLPEAVNALLATTGKYRRDRVTGTPGAPNRPLQQSSAPRSKLSARIEQAGTDRQPSRRGAYVLEQRELFGESATRSADTYPSRGRYEQRSLRKPWQRMDQALRVTDLLLQAGGFSVIVLDLADIPAEFVSRVPLATWFRFRAGAEHAQCALLVLTQHPCTGSSAALVLKMQGFGDLEGTATYFPGLRFSVEVGRQRFPSHQALSAVVPMRKPPQGIAATNWEAHSAWVGRQ